MRIFTGVPRGGGSNGSGVVDSTETINSFSYVPPVHVTSRVFVNNGEVGVSGFFLNFVSCSALLM